jgi:hypothetical protein
VNVVEDWLLVRNFSLPRFTLFFFFTLLSAKRRFQFSMKTSFSSQSQDLGFMSSAASALSRPPLQKSMTISTASNHREHRLLTSSTNSSQNGSVDQV